MATYYILRDLVYKSISTYTSNQCNQKIINILLLLSSKRIDTFI